MVAEAFWFLLECSERKRFPGCQRRQIPLAQFIIPRGQSVVDELVYFLHSLGILRLYLSEVLTLSGCGRRVCRVYAEKHVSNIIHDLRFAGQPKTIAAAYQPILQSIELLDVAVEVFHHVFVRLFVQRLSRSLRMLELILDAVEKTKGIVSRSLHITKLHLQIQLRLQVGRRNSQGRIKTHLDGLHEKLFTNC